MSTYFAQFYWWICLISWRCFRRGFSILYKADSRKNTETSWSALLKFEFQWNIYQNISIFRFCFYNFYQCEDKYVNAILNNMPRSQAVVGWHLRTQHTQHQFTLYNLRFTTTRLNTNQDFKFNILLWSHFRSFN